METLVYGEAPADSAPGGSRELRLDLYRPPDSTSATRPGLVLLHGGGYTGGRRDLAENRQVGRALASRGYVVASIDYRLWKDRPVVSDWARDLADRVARVGHRALERRSAALGGDEWLAAMGAAAEDALRALDWMRSQGPRFGVDPERIALGGMSAGALTSIQVAYRLKHFGVEVPPISAVLAVRGAQLLVPGEASDPVSSGPPLFIVHGTADPVIPFDAAVRTYRAVRAAGVPVELHPLHGVDHDDTEMGGDGMLQARLDDGSLLVDRLDRFLSAAFHCPGSLEPAACIGTGGGCPGMGDLNESGDGDLHPEPHEELHDAAEALIASVKPEAAFVEELLGFRRADELLSGFGDENRLDWSFWPRPRGGLTLGRMTAGQRVEVQNLLAGILSARGYLKVAHIMLLERLLEDRETVGFPRGAEHYTVSIFGSPEGTAPWGWRFEGHHVSLNVTVADGELSVTPSFLGASPAARQGGPHAGFRPLRYERELARRLLLSLRPDQARETLLADTVPGDILSSQFRKAPGEWNEWRSLLQPDGAPAAGFDSRQRALLERILDQVVGVYRPEIAASYRKGIHTDSLWFAWMGSEERGAPQYFRIQGPSFVFEFDASQEAGDHVHTVWRDRRNDFGEEILRRHYEDHEHRVP